MRLNFSGFTQQFEQDGAPFCARVYAGKGLPPSGFNVGTFCLKASEHASLKWDVTEAHRYPMLLWELDLGLTEAICADEPRLIALELAISHFTQTVWPQFEKKTFGVILYRGWFNSCLVEPLKSLAAHLPQTVRPFVLFDTEKIEDEKTYFRCLNQADLGFLLPILKGPFAKKYPFAFPALGWEHGDSPLGYFAESYLTSSEQQEVLIATLLPNEGEFILPKGRFRVIPESILTHEWEGIDRLLVVSSSVTHECRRKLLGFCAAGGEVLSVGESLGLPGEQVIDSQDVEEELLQLEISQLASLDVSN